MTILNSHKLNIIQIIYTIFPFFICPCCLLFSIEFRFCVQYRYIYVFIFYSDFPCKRINFVFFCLFDLVFGNQYSISFRNSHCARIYNIFSLSFHNSNKRFLSIYFLLFSVCKEFRANNRRKCVDLYGNDNFCLVLTTHAHKKR